VVLLEVTELLLKQVLALEAGLEGGDLSLEVKVVLSQTEDFLDSCFRGLLGVEFLL
jgi:hypothetical protein